MRPHPLMPLAAVLALVPAQAFAASEPPVACVYLATKKVPRDVMVALIKSGFKPTNGTEKTAMTQIGESVGACRQSNGWSQKRQDAAVRYLNGRVLREDAVYQGKAMGVTPQILDGIVAKLDPASRAGYGTGQVTSEANKLAVAELQAAGIKLETMSAEDRQKLGNVIAQGAAGTVVAADSAAQFAH